MKQEGFTPIGQTAATVTRKNPPEVGSSVGQTAVALSQDAMRAAAWLSKQTPADVDKAALLRASSLNAGLAVRMIDGLPIKVSVSGDAMARVEAAKALAGFLTPAPKGKIEEWIAELSVITRRRQDDDITESLRLSAYSSRLAEYPADVAREALLRHKWLFFPAWAELQDVCDKLAAPRRAMIWHLKNAPQAQEPDERETPSAERRAEMVAYAQRVTKEMAERAKNGN
jgi:hypothetical protein